jgi:putative heme-binding domain-containing protein
MAREADQRERDLERLADLVSAAVPLVVAEAAIDRLAQLDDRQIGSALVARLIGLSPALRSRAFDVILSRNEWTNALLDGLRQDERLAASIDPSRRQRLLTHASSGIRTRAEQVFGAFQHGDRQAIIAEYAAAVGTPGDAERGRVVFKVNCAACHRLHDVGNEVGPNLASVKDKSPQVLLEAILNPSRAVEDKFIAYNAATTDGRTFSGLIQSESGNSIILTAADGRSQSILRSELEALVSTGRSLMPDGFEKTIPPAAMNDLLAFIAHATTGSAPSTPAGSAPKTIVADASGAIHLLPRDAVLHGVKVGINPHADCISWMVEGDRAEWTIEVPAAGRYDVRIEWAQIDELADNPFVVAAGSEKVVGKFPSTHAWAQYENRVFGQLTLPAGQTRLILQPNGPVKAELSDVRSITLLPVAKPR